MPAGDTDFRLSSTPALRPDPGLPAQAPVAPPPRGGWAWVWVLATLLAGVLLTLVLHHQ